MPQAIRYRPTASPTADSGTFPAKNCSNAKSESQNAPNEVNAVAPNVLLFLNSHMPASSCANPPYARARPRTTGSPPLLTKLALKKLSTNVVRANAARPNGAGSAIGSAAILMDPTALSPLPASFVPLPGRRAVVASITHLLLPTFRGLQVIATHY